MFKGNKIVLILPGILALLMLFGGYSFLNSTETVTNEELEKHVQLDARVIEAKEEVKVVVEWDWTMLPQEGIYGEDYLGISVDSSKVQSVESTMQLFHAGHMMEEIEGQVVENGVIFPIPNKINENVILGNRGRAEVVFSGELSPEQIVVKLLHTWMDHIPLEKVDADFSQPSFGEALNVPYWIKEGEIDY